MPLGSPPLNVDGPDGLKDEVLDRLAQEYNIAQFVSFAPGQDARQRFARLRDVAPGMDLADPASAAGALLARSMTGTVNVRTFRSDRPKGNPFEYGVAAAEDVARLVRRYAADGFYVIVNETIDVADGGVSGVRTGTVTEFAPGGTPRIVEEEGVCSLPPALADALFEKVYGVRLALPSGGDLRVEFSVHPIPVGYRRQRWVVWEVAREPGPPLRPTLRWPNRFSRHVGDKAFGLLVAELVGLPVPRAIVLARAVAPFRFGSPVGRGDVWVRTCPLDFSPGSFPTVHGWTDPFRLIQQVDPDGDQIASVVVQDGVDAQWSGAARSDGDEVIIEGVHGAGDRFMVGLDGPEPLPDDVTNDVAKVLAQAAEIFGPVRIEWAADPERVWVVQLNQRASSAVVIIAPGDAMNWLPFDPASGLHVLRDVVKAARRRRAGVEVTRWVGLTSHVGDVLRAAGIPARMADRRP